MVVTVAKKFKNKTWPFGAPLVSPLSKPLHREIEHWLFLSLGPLFCLRNKSDVTNLSCTTMPLLMRGVTS